MDFPVKIWDYNGSSFDSRHEQYLIEDAEDETTAIASLNYNETMVATGSSGGLVQLFDLRL